MCCPMTRSCDLMHWSYLFSDEVRPRVVTPFQICGHSSAFALNFSVLMVNGVAQLTKLEDPKTGEVHVVEREEREL